MKLAISESRMNSDTDMFRAPFDLTKKKKKTFVVQDAIEDSAESHGRHTICCLIVQEEFIGYIAEHPNDEEEVEGIDLHQQRYPWEGSDMDYLYDEVEYNADDNAIKKQYRKFALHLHPDKNKLPGAEAAFKMIGEAQRVLLDKDKRRLHDMIRKPFKRHAPGVPSYQPQPQQHAPPPRPFYTAPVFNAARSSFTNQAKPQAQAPQPAGFSESRTFWACCAFCHIKHECVKEFLHKQVICPSCGKLSVAFQTAFQAPPAQPTFSFYQQSKVPAQETAAHKQQPESSVRVSPRKEASKAKSSGSSAEHINGNGKRKKIVESDDSEGSYECEEVAATGGQRSRKSVRSKQKVSYEETLPNGRNRKEKAKDDQVGSSRGSRASDLEILQCADPDFTNFEKLREESSFKAGQIWAMYDDKDKMPRYYANIRKVIRKPNFTLKITWLEHKPDDERAKGWARRKLPVSVGKYQLVGDDNASETPSFSHLISPTVRGSKDIVCVLKDLHQKCQKEMDDYVGCMYYYTNEFDLCRKEQEAFEKVCPLK
ncbi:hypothetical protein F2Q68_00022420 [Brassica cretica]|uniref:J domain-containing protein n=1 Tax=Brassica cretica TaxID=69181 RepID=A0A8S9G3U9_BRACR|nr:hypothetical protein F2Q68_00022420 [Brassica cretica]